MPDSEKLTALNAATASAANGNVPMALHPDNLLRIGQICVDAPYAGPSIDAYGAGRAALKSLYDSATQIVTAHRDALKALPVVGAIMAKGSKPILKLQIPAAVAPELASAMASSASRAAANCERHVAAVDQALDKIENFITQKTSTPRPNDASVVAESTQIREYVKNLSSTARMGFLLDSAREGDKAVVFSVLSASPFTSGLDRNQHWLLRKHAEDKFAPVEAKQREALIEIKGKIQSAMSGYANLYAKHLPKITADPGTTSLAALKAGLA
jgi:hypothetical protein